MVHDGDGPGNSTDDGAGAPDPSAEPNTDDGDFYGEQFSPSSAVSTQSAQVPAYHRRMNRVRRQPSVASTFKSASPTEASLEATIPQSTISSLPSLPTTAPDPVLPSLPTIPGDTQTAPGVAGSSAPPQAAAKPTAAKKSSCTPSPTKSLAPSATWTTCPYVSRDGQVNPDVRTLNGPGAINSVSQSVLYNALSFCFTKTTTYSQNVASFIDTFFLNPSTKMNPNMNFGQIVRGPGPDGRQGTFTGVLDLRGLVKIVNAISMVKACQSSDWTDARNKAMTAWMGQYAGWLTDSPLGKMTASRPNNHGTFFVSQLVAAKMFANDNNGAATVLRNFFARQFLDQIAASGEQPFEAVRTRPYHYRCFNLEALIVNIHFCPRSIG